MNIHCEFSSRFHSDSKRIRSGFVSKRRESPRIHNVFAQQYGFANFGRVFTVIHCETLSWVKSHNQSSNSEPPDDESQKTLQLQLDDKQSLLLKSSCNLRDQARINAISLLMQVHGFN